MSVSCVVWVAVRTLCWVMRTSGMVGSLSGTVPGTRALDARHAGREYPACGRDVPGTQAGVSAPPSGRGQPGSEPGPDRARSEEHTSELQSRGHLVCRLLLE